MMERNRQYDSDPAMLSDYDGNRRNNFTSLRILFAWAVLFGHSFAVTGQKELNPIRPFFEGSIWIGEIAVSGFFAISGYLVTASFVRRGLLDYTVSRMLRIYPALVVCVFLSVFALGLAMTTLGGQEYLAHPQTWDYLWNSTALFRPTYRLPGVFEGLPRMGVNGSLWTLPAEVSCYIVLALIGFFGLLRSRFLANVAIVAILLFGLEHFSQLPMIGRIHRWADPALYFLLGVAFFINRESIPLTGRLAVLSALVFYFALGEPWFGKVAPMALVYLIFFLAYRTPYLNVDGRIGDPSYGIYIYAWPVQQTLVTLFPEEGPYFNTMAATVITVTLAMLSWRLLEKPALGLKGRFLTHGAKR